MCSVCIQPNVLRALHRIALSLGVAATLLSGCTKPRETTAIGAAAGGVMGAGLGAIIGNQTGNAGSGLAIGALAGAATGTLIGNALQAQQETVRAHAEVLERQERVVEAQRAEIAELRTLNADVIERKRTALQKRGPLPYGATGIKSAQAPVSQQDPLARLNPRAHTAPLFPASASDAGRAGTAASGANNAAPITSTASATKGTAATRRAPEPLFDSSSRSAATGRDVQMVPSRGAVGIGGSGKETKDSNRSSSRTEAGKAVVSAPDTATDSCKDAEREVTAAAAVRDESEKLFHLRRALRLCPENARMHYELGAVYAKLGRGADAQAEYKEALELDPSYQPARAQLKAAAPVEAESAGETDGDAVEF
jgi:tetratricopeptide (TPR) repeat protein